MMSDSRFQTSDRLARVVALVGQLFDENGKQIEACNHEPSRLSEPELAGRGLNRPCELNELMSHSII
jgi:hypothetical protein